MRRNQQAEKVMDQPPPVKGRRTLQLVLTISGFLLVAIGIFSFATGFMLVEGEFPLVPVVLIAGGLADLFLSWIVFRDPDA